MTVTVIMVRQSIYLHLTMVEADSEVFISQIDEAAGLICEVGLLTVFWVTGKCTGFSGL